MSKLSQAQTVVRAHSLTKIFGIGVQQTIALNDVSLSLRAGELTLLMGPSGSGKSSTISCLGGLEKPNAGSVHVFGDDLWSRSNREINEFRKEKCGFVFQSVGLFPALSAVEQIAIPLWHLGWSKRLAHRAALSALEEVDLLDRAQSRPSEMSGGQNQRVAIARMLAKQPQLIFCDEPTSALDGDSGANIARLLKEAAGKHNAMILCVTHDDRLQTYADRILHIVDGQIENDRVNDCAEA